MQEKPSSKPLHTYLQEPEVSPSNTPPQVSQPEPNPKLIKEKKGLKAEKKELMNKSDAILFEEIMRILECHNPRAYRSKIKGFSLAFNITDKVRITSEEGKKNQYRPTIKYYEKKILKRNLPQPISQEEKRRLQEKSR